MQKEKGKTEVTSKRRVVVLDFEHKHSFKQA